MSNKNQFITIIIRKLCKVNRWKFHCAPRFLPHLHLKRPLFSFYVIKFRVTAYFHDLFNAGIVIIFRSLCVHITKGRRFRHDLFSTCYCFDIQCTGVGLSESVRSLYNILPVPVYACIDWALLERKIFTDSKLKMDMDVHWKPFRVFNYLTDVCVNLIFFYPNVTVKDNSKKKLIYSACLLVFMWMFIVFLRLREGNTSKWRS